MLLIRNAFGVLGLTMQHHKKRTDANVSLIFSFDTGAESLEVQSLYTSRLSHIPVQQAVPAEHFLVD